MYTKKALGCHAIYVHHITQYTVPQMNACMHASSAHKRQYIHTSLLIRSQNAQVHTQTLRIPSYSPKIR